MKAFPSEQDPGVRQLLVEFAHFGQQFFTRHHAGFRVLAGFDDDHETHSGNSFPVNSFPSHPPGFHDSRMKKPKSTKSPICYGSTPRTRPYVLTDSWQAGHVSDRPNFHSADAGARHAAGDRDRFVQIFAVDEKVSRELLMRFGIGAVCHHLLMVTDPDTCGC